MGKLNKFIEKHSDLQKTEEEKSAILKKNSSQLRWIQVPALILKDVNVKKKTPIYVITLAKNLLRYIVQITEKSPKKFRFTFISRMQNYAIDILENLFKAEQYRTDIIETARLRKNHQKDAYTKLKLLSYISFLACENKCILERQYLLIAKQIDEIMKYLVLWMQKKD